MSRSCKLMYWGPLLLALLFSLSCRDPCEGNYFCSGGVSPIGSDATWTPRLVRMNEKPLRKYAANGLLLRCTVFPAFGDDVSISLQMPNGRAVDNTITAKRLRRRHGAVVDGAGASLVPETSSRSLNEDEVHGLLALYRTSNLWEARSKPEPRDWLNMDGETWIIEVKHSAKYQAIERATRIEPSLRQLCEWMVRHSPLTGNVTNGDSVIIEK